MALMKDLIAIPERVHQGDFVLKLADGVSHAKQTLRDYVVTRGTCSFVWGRQHLNEGSTSPACSR